MGTEVQILGQTYVVKGNDPPDYIKELAAFLDGRIKEVYSVLPGTPPLKATILAALNITDELFKTRNEQAAISKGIREIETKADAILDLFEQDQFERSL
jgi:cell division protein ZapA